MEIVQKTLLNCEKVKNEKEAEKLMNDVIKNGSALKKLKEIIKAQGGNTEVINDYSLFSTGKHKYELKAKKDGKITKIDALDIAAAAKTLGAGRDKKTDSIDYGAGVVLKKKTKDSIKKGETLLELYYNDKYKTKLDEAINFASSSFKIS